MKKKRKIKNTRIRGRAEEKRENDERIVKERSKG